MSYRAHLGIKRTGKRFSRKLQIVYFNFRIIKKLMTSESWKFPWKTNFFGKKCNNSKKNWNSKKKLSATLYNRLFRFDWYVYRLCKSNHSSPGRFTKDPLFSHFLWMTRFLWWKSKIVQKINPIYFSILRMSTKFH